MENMVSSMDFWQNKKVFLTGHTGFKGSWLSIWLDLLGADVTGYSLEPPTKPSLFELARLSEHMKDIRGDVRDLGSLQKALNDSEAEIVIHMAAQPLVRDSYQFPVETYATNVMGTVNVLEAVRTAKTVKAVINVTTDKCYENREWYWGYRENEPLGGYDPYSSSKACSELVTSAYRNSFFNYNNYTKHGVAVASARAGNVIGGGDWSKDRLVPDCIRAICRGDKITIRSPESIRPWQHVLDPLHGYLLLAQKLYEEGSLYAEAWNFGPNDEDAKPVQWIVEKITGAWGKEAVWVKDKRISPHEANFLKLDCSKAKARLNWHPRLHLAGALSQVIDWYRAFQDGEKMREFTLRQITDFSNCIDKN
jgi:CDP-glucose 4,6-dehydratase